MGPFPNVCLPTSLESLLTSVGQWASANFWANLPPHAGSRPRLARAALKAGATRGREWAAPSWGSPAGGPLGFAGGAESLPQPGSLQMPHNPGSQAHSQRGSGPAPRPPGTCGRARRGSWAPGLWVLFTVGTSVQSYPGEGVELGSGPTASPHSNWLPLASACGPPQTLRPTLEPSCPPSPGTKGFAGLSRPGWASLPFRTLPSCRYGQDDSGCGSREQAEGVHMCLQQHR